jgi:hypothetical protein
MHILTCCALGFLVSTLCIAAPTKLSNGCGYEVRGFQDICSIYIIQDIYSRHAILVIQISSIYMSLHTHMTMLDGKKRLTNITTEVCITIYGVVDFFTNQNYDSS